MKKIILPLISICLLVVCNYSISQEIRRCGTTEYMKGLWAQDPSLKQKREQLEKYTASWIAEHKGFLYEKTTDVTVSVVVHIVYQNSAQNISDTRVQEQIDILNRDFSGQNPHSMHAFPDSMKANTHIQFVLAQTDPDGNATTGIERVSTTCTSFGTNDYMKYTSHGGAAAWDPTSYFNIWVCNLGNSLCAYAQFPAAGINNTYGLVVHYQYFGITGAISPYNGGATSTHEIGHCFNLYNTFSDSCSGPGDYCVDTPPQSSDFNTEHSFSGGVVTDTCSQVAPGIMYMDFMNDADDATYANFTPDQAARMYSLFDTGGILYHLANPNASSVSENSMKEIKIYPNPATGNVTIDAASNQVLNGSITDVLGKEMMPLNFSGNQYQNIDISALPCGVYFVRLQIADRVIVQKIIVQR
jgi:hypothetical protein